MTDWTTVTVRPEVRDRLRGFKRGGESYSEVIVRMMDEHEQESDETVVEE